MLVRALPAMVGITLLVSACGPQARPAAGTSTSSAGLGEAASPSPASTSSPAGQGGPVGYLEGQATIGPLQPGPVRVGAPPPTPSPETCTARQLAIETADGTTEVTRFALAADCTFRVALPPGTYRVRVVQTNPIDRARNLPQTVVIAPGATARVDPDIDTGMR